MIERLIAAVDQAGGLRAYAKANDIAFGYVSDVLARRQRPGPAILKALGLRKAEHRYEEADRPET